MTRVTPSQGVLGEVERYLQDFFLRRRSDMRENHVHAALSVSAFSTAFVRSGANSRAWKRRTRCLQVCDASYIVLQPRILSSELATSVTSTISSSLATTARATPMSSGPRRTRSGTGTMDSSLQTLRISSHTLCNVDLRRGSKDIASKSGESFSTVTKEEGLSVSTTGVVPL